MTEFNPYSPRNGEEMLRACPPGTRIYLYSDLASDPRSSLDILKSMGRDNLILYQDPDKMNSGHWSSLSFRPEKMEAYFFSSYGGKPDFEKNQWLTQSALRNSGQYRNVINDGLKELFKQGWTIYYNDYPYQRVGDHTATCGVWSAAFLRSGVNPDIFEDHHLSDPEEYFRKYFR